LDLQAVSVAEKETVAESTNPKYKNGYYGGGIDANGNARPDLVTAVNHTDQSIGLILNALQAQGLASSTLVILTSKHGQNPAQDAQLPTSTSATVDSVGLQSTFDNSSGANYDPSNGTLTPVAGLLASNGIKVADEIGGDTSSMIFLQDPTQLQQALTILNAKNYASIDSSIDPVTGIAFSTEEAAGQGTVLSGQGIINAGLGNPATNDRTPDIVVELNTGYFFGNGFKKRAEHGGFTTSDTNVALVVGSAGLSSSLQGTTNTTTVSTTQIAPTTLEALGLDPNLLTGAVQDGTKDLNGLLSNTLAVSSNHILDLTGGSGTLKFALNSNDQKSLNEIGVFQVDDANGDIIDTDPNSSTYGQTFTPGSKGYTQEALKESKVLYGLDPVANRDRTTNLQGQFFQSGKRLGFYLIQNGTSNQELAALDGKISNTPNISFSFQSASGGLNLTTTTATNGQVTYSWANSSGTTVSSFTVTPTTSLSNLGLQTINPIVDTRSTGAVNATFSVTSDALFDNTLAFYVVQDTAGTIKASNGTTLTPGQAGYAQAAAGLVVSGLTFDKHVNSASSISDQFNSADQSWQSSSTGTFAAGEILAPILIANGNIQSFLSQNPNNSAPSNLGNPGASPIAYFAFIGANTDGIDHIRELPGNELGFKDWYGGGDLDYNDVVAKITTTGTLSTLAPTYA
jgi:hypothetical protein